MIDWEEYYSRALKDFVRACTACIVHMQTCVSQENVLWHVLEVNERDLLSSRVIVLLSESCCLSIKMPSGILTPRLLVPIHL